MIENLKIYTRDFGTCMIGVSKNAVYFSSKFRKFMGHRAGDRFVFRYDADSGDVIAVRPVPNADKNGYVMNKYGYCKLRIASKVAMGRYMLIMADGDSYIFKRSNTTN